MKKVIVRSGGYMSLRDFHSIVGSSPRYCHDRDNEGESLVVSGNMKLKTYLLNLPSTLKVGAKQEEYSIRVCENSNCDNVVAVRTRSRVPQS